MSKACPYRFCFGGYVRRGGAVGVVLGGVVGCGGGDRICAQALFSST